VLHHISFAVSILERSAKFYDAALAELGYRRVNSSARFIGYGVENRKDKFAIALSEDKVMVPKKGFHLALSSPTREAVVGFHVASFSVRLTTPAVPTAWIDAGINSP